MRERLTGALVALAAVLALGGCGSKGSSGGGAGKSGEPKKTAGFDGKTIKLGVLTPLSGPAAVIGNPLTAGNEVWFDYLNAKGGIAGRYKVELVQEDTQYSTTRTVQQYNKLKRQVVGFTQVFGTAPTLAVLPQLKRDKAIAAPASLDANWVRDDNLLPVGGPYQVQAVNALDYYVKEGGGKGKLICSMIQDDAYGEAGQQGIDFAAKELNFKTETTQKFKTGDKDVTGQIANLEQRKCDAVFLVATPGDAGTIWGAAAKAGFAPRWIGQSPVWVNALATSPLKSYLEKTTWIVSEGTEWGDTKVKGMADMVARVRKYKPSQQPDYYFSFGYNQARAMTALLEKAVQRGDLSREGLLKASSQLGTVSFDGLTGDYTYGAAAKRNPPRTSTVFGVDPAKPFGLKVLKYNFASEAAKKLPFKAASP